MLCVHSNMPGQCLIPSFWQTSQLSAKCGQVSTRPGQLWSVVGLGFTSTKQSRSWGRSFSHSTQPVPCWGISPTATLMGQHLRPLLLLEWDHLLAHPRDDVCGVRAGKCFHSPSPALQIKPCGHARAIQGGLLGPNRLCSLF